MLRRGVTANTTGGVSGIKGEGETSPRQAGQRILVVEDNRDSADSLRLLLRFFGHEVAVAYSGYDGVRAAELYRPDVVLCDIGLPGLDGYGVARKLRDNPATAKARLIAVTAYGRDEDRRRSHEAGFELHLAGISRGPYLGVPAAHLAVAFALRSPRSMAVNYAAPREGRPGIAARGLFMLGQIVRGAVRTAAGLALGAVPGTLYGALVGMVHLGVSGRWDRAPAFAVGCTLAGALFGLLGGVGWALSGEPAPAGSPPPAGRRREERRRITLNRRGRGRTIGAGPPPIRGPAHARPLPRLPSRDRPGPA
jgi:CheY-like chemotaxis protein